MVSGKTVFVTGATGNQGGAAVRHLLSRGFRVKALVRNPASLRTKKLIEQKVELIHGDLNDPSTFATHISSGDLVFCNLHYSAGVDREIRQGIQLAGLAREKGVRHFVYSSVVGSDRNTGIPHWESKHTIEQFIQSTGMDHTILRPSSLYENLLLPQVKSRILKGKLVLPVRAETVQEFISADDIGRISAEILAAPSKYSGKVIHLAAERMTGSQLAHLFAEELNRKIKFQMLPPLLTRLLMGRDLAKMFRWVNNNKTLFVPDMEALKTEFPGMISLKQWIGEHFVNSPA